jgi:hypothetical protein
MYTPTIILKGDRHRLIKMKYRMQWAMAALDAEEARLRIKLADVEERMRKAGIPIPLPTPVQGVLL